MNRHISLIVILAILGIIKADINIGLNTKNGHFNVFIENQLWLTSGDFGFYHQNEWYSTKNTDKDLFLLNVNNSNGNDQFGKYNATTFNWGIKKNSIEPFWSTRITQYHNDHMVTFTQKFYYPITNTGVRKTDDLVSVYPSFANATKTHINYLTFSGNFGKPSVGVWPETVNFMDHGGIPLVLNDLDGKVVIVSPFDSFMVSGQLISPHFGYLACGIEGMVNYIPGGYEYTTILYSGNGVNRAMYEWGELYLRKSSKPRVKDSDDMTIQTLGYWTDNGAYYYYNTVPHKNYEKTMSDVKMYLDSIKVPVKNYQLDSWWYYKGENNGVKLWEPRHDIFPNGIKNLQEILDAPLILHNRYFSPDNLYSTEMNFPFQTETRMALPKDSNLFTYIMGLAKEWGMSVYEQDWLITTFEGMESTQNTTDFAETWLRNMGFAAKELDLNIQYCMPLPRFLLESSKIDKVTQSRASDDYHPDNDQWQVGYTSMLIHSLGIFPFKDNFWSNSDEQVGCPPRYGECREYNNVLEAIVSCLSNGPIGISDGINYVNRSLVMQTCREDGILLKLDRPATVMDHTFLTKTPAIAQISSTTSTLTVKNEKLTWAYLLLAETEQQTVITLADLGLSGTYSWQNYGDDHIHILSEKYPILVPALPSTKEKVNFRYLQIAPIRLKSQWNILGEEKIVSSSRTRFTYTEFSETSVVATLSGAPSEIVSLKLHHGDLTGTARYESLKCTLNKEGTAQVTCSVTCTC
eukprot:TRINITY_DN5943_c0_g1_i1.p1 TRINITY_DN5943_c0_g1~~TRINITY_DN5943_c0_g1_i1.p1  ORF type:complete len:747 (+),score=106.83 TRINITY_DN5943_c0_g1_i1:13-2253(+)